MNSVLVVEDERHLAEGLRFNLEAEGYRVHIAETGEAALKLLSGEPPAFDVVLLDVMLPGKDGFSVMLEMRQAGNFIPTLMLTARIQGLLRRRDWLRASLNHEAPNHHTANQASHATAPPEPKGTFTFGEKSVHFDLLELRVRGQKFPLTLMEANVLRYLIQHEGAPVSRKAMLEEVWGLHEDTDTRAIDNFIVRLRRYIEDDPTRPRHLLTVRGVGYRFVASPAEAG
jgi:DNA-binding response OmpR family regulator